MIGYNPRDPLIDRAVLLLDPANTKSFGKNVQPNALDLFAWGGGIPVNCTLSRDTSTGRSPVGGIPLRMDVTANDPYVGTYASPIYTLSPGGVGQTWTSSVYVKASAATTAQLFLFGCDDTHLAYIDSTALAIPITTTWTRISVTHTFTNPSVRYVQARLDGPDSGGTGLTLWFDGMQVEQAASPTPFKESTNIGGTAFKSLSANAITATMYGAVPFDADGGGCWNFSTNTGAQGNLSALGFTFAANMIPVTGNFVLSAWVKNPTTVGGNTQPAIFYNAGGGDGYRFGAHAGGFYVLGGFPYFEQTATYTFTNNVWYNIVAVFDRAGVDTGQAKVTFYVNGAYIHQFGLGMPQTSMNNSPPGIVRNPYGGGTYLGKLGVLAAYRGHATPAEVQQLFASQRGRYGV